jgi:hypothetical protein
MDLTMLSNSSEIMMEKYHRLASRRESLLGSLIQEVPGLERMGRMRWVASPLSNIFPHTSPSDTISFASSVTPNREEYPQLFTKLLINHLTK